MAELIKIEDVLKQNSTIKCENAHEQKNVINILKARGLIAFCGKNVDSSGLYICLNGKVGNYLTMDVPATRPQIDSSDIDYN